jgi:hypothetical protein
MNNKYIKKHINKILKNNKIVEKTKLYLQIIIHKFPRT